MEYKQLLKIEILSLCIKIYTTINQPTGPGNSENKEIIFIMDKNVEKIYLFWVMNMYEKKLY